MALCLRLYPMALLFVVAAWSVACSSDDSARSSPSTGVPPANVDGGEPPTYPEPVVLVPGKYISPGGIPEAREEGMAAFHVDQAKGIYEGTIGGIRLVKTWDDFYSYRYPCSGEDFAEFRVADMLSFSYLPPGTAALGPQTAAICLDGSMANAGQQFATFNTTFNI